MVPGRQRGSPGSGIRDLGTLRVDQRDASRVAGGDYGSPTCNEVFHAGTEVHERNEAGPGGTSRSYARHPSSQACTAEDNFVVVSIHNLCAVNSEKAGHIEPCDIAQI